MLNYKRGQKKNYFSFSFFTFSSRRASARHLPAIYLPTVDPTSEINFQPFKIAGEVT